MVFRRKAARTKEVSGRAKEIGAELTAGVDHLRNAAVVTKDVARDKLGPSVESARGALAPRVGHARELVEPRVEAAREAVKPAWDSALASLAPIVAAAVEAQERSKKAGRRAEKRSRPARKEARRRAMEASLALRGERRRRWPMAFGALVVGAAAGVVGGALARRASRPAWEEYDSTEGGQHASTTARTRAGGAQEKLRDTANTVKGKVTEAAGTVKEKASGAASTARGKLQNSTDKPSETPSETPAEPVPHGATTTSSTVSTEPGHNGHQA
jgi:uncharacterized protein YjbJ (UPF0337 family)